MSKEHKIGRTIREKSIVMSAGLMLVLVLINTGFLIYNNYVQEKAMVAQAQAQEIKSTLSDIWDSVIRNIDLGLRGYALTQDENLLGPYNNGRSLYIGYIDQVYKQLQEQGYPDMAGFETVRNGYADYLNVCETMLEMVKMDSMELFYNELKLDRGLTLWHIYEKYANEVNAYQDKQSTLAANTYKKANTRMTIIQFLLGIIGIPTLLYVMLRISRVEKIRRNLFKNLDKSNREYLFNPGNELRAENEQELINNSIVNLQKAATFINQISVGNLEVNWEDLNEENKPFNQKNLAGELINMREKMKALKSEDAKRMWMTEGEAKFSEIIRTHQHDLQLLCDKTVAFIVKYLSAQQGALYVLRDIEEDTYLELKSCYAFDRKKFVENKIEPGQGLVGQTYLEGQAIVLTEIPDRYTYITSGLGESTPRCLILTPMKYNENVEAVIEIAGFQRFERYQQEWLNKIGEIMASTLISIKTTEKTQVLLKQFQEQAEQLRSQEEELRQNLEEMEATQEEMRRQAKELDERERAGN